MSSVIWFNASHCEGPSCDTWSLSPQEHGFLVVLWDESQLVFCSPDCLLKGMAERSTPIEVIDL